MKVNCQLKPLGTSVDEGWALSWEIVRGHIWTEHFTDSGAALARLASIWPFMELRAKIQAEIQRNRVPDFRCSPKPDAIGWRAESDDGADVLGELEPA